MSRTLAHSVRHNADLVRHLVRRDFTLSYRRSALGILWSLLLPLAQAFVLVFVFQRVVPLNIEAYPAFLLTALLPWTWFSTSILASSSMFLNNRDLMRRPNFGPGILVLVSTLSNLVTYLCALPVLFGVLVVYGRPFGATLLMFPVLLLIQALLMVGIGLIVATLNVFYRDVQYVVTVALLLLFYLTPVFYRGDPTLPGYAFISAVNPLAPLVESYRDIFFDGTMPPAGRLVVVAMLSAALSAAGYGIYRSMQHDMIDTI